MATQYNYVSNIDTQIRGDGEHFADVFEMVLEEYTNVPLDLVNYLTRNYSMNSQIQTVLKVGNVHARDYIANSVNETDIAKVGLVNIVTDLFILGVQHDKFFGRSFNPNINNAHINSMSGGYARCIYGMFIDGVIKAGKSIDIPSGNQIEARTGSTASMMSYDTLVALGVVCGRKNLDTGNMKVLMSAMQYGNLLKDPRVISLDFRERNDMSPAKTGRLETTLGFEIIRMSQVQGIRGEIKEFPVDTNAGTEMVYVVNNSIDFPSLMTNTPKVEFTGGTKTGSFVDVNMLGGGFGMALSEGETMLTVQCKSS